MNTKQIAGILIIAPFLMTFFQCCQGSWYLTNKLKNIFGHR